MNRIIQLILFFILIIVISVFYNVYFKKKVKGEIEKTVSINEPIDQKKNNLIKNLTYEISIRENNDYQIKSELSEITYKDGSELILMKMVTATLSDKTKVSLFVTSDDANYNNENYNTNFENNVEIKYLDSIIYADNMILDFKNSFISVYNNVRYNGPLGNLEADNIKINLITKKIDVFMNDTGKNIENTSSK